MCPRVRLYLACISPISRHISPTSPPHLPGGGTRFTKLPADSNCTSIVTGVTDPNCVARDIPGTTPGTSPVTFQPKAGKDILWPSVLAGAPHSKDSRTDHEALPVTAGEKFGANFWIHQVNPNPNPDSDPNPSPNPNPDPDPISL